MTDEVGNEINEESTGGSIPLGAMVRYSKFMGDNYGYPENGLSFRRHIPD